MGFRCEEGWSFSVMLERLKFARIYTLGTLEKMPADDESYDAAWGRGPAS